MTSGDVSSSAPTPGDDEFRALALRMLAMYHPQFGGAVPEEHVQLIPGAVAPEFPHDVPLPEGSRVVGSFLSGRQVTVVLDADQTLEQVYDVYAERLPELGWSLAEHPFPPAFGFAMPEPERGARQLTRQVGHIGGPSGHFGTFHLEYGRGEAEPTLHISATVREPEQSGAAPDAGGDEGTRKEPGPIDLRLTWVQADTSPHSHRRIMQRPMTEHLPVFSAPPGANQQAGGMSYAPSYHFSSRASLYARGLDVPAIGRHYAEQLERAGWTQSAADATGPVAWSIWTLIDREGVKWSAMLTAVQLPGAFERYELSFDAEAVRPPTRAAQAGSMSGGYSAIGMQSHGVRPPSS